MCLDATGFGHLGWLPYLHRCRVASGALLSCLLRLVAIAAEDSAVRVVPMLETTNNFYVY